MTSDEEVGLVDGGVTGVAEKRGVRVAVQRGRLFAELTSPCLGSHIPQLVN